jgi:hypothetical protein
MEELEVLSKKDVVLTHEEEVRLLFDKLTVKVPDSELSYITFDAFKVAIDQMMNKAFHQGAVNNLQTVEAVIDNIFKKN